MFVLIPLTAALCFGLVLKPKDALHSDATLAEPFCKIQSHP